MPIGRNQPCPCGSGKKYKKCCLPKDEARARESTPLPIAPPSRIAKPRGDFFGHVGMNMTPGLVTALVHSLGFEKRFEKIGLTPYTVLKVRTDERGMDDPDFGRVVARNRRGWTIEKVQ